MLLVAAGLGALSGSGVAQARGPEPATTVHEVAGPSGEVEIVVDRWGVPHIYAASLDDVFFGQGFNAARDRLWQLDLWKRRGEGTLAEVFGPAFVEKDAAARRLLFRGDMRAEWLAYASDTKRIVSAFVAGVNAYIELTRREPERLPMGFRLLDYRPAPWTPETVVRIRSHGLLYNAASEDARARLLRDHGPEALRLRELLQPPHRLALPEGLELAAYPDGALTLYELARSPVRFARGAGGELRLAASSAGSAPPHTGSNNWAIAPARSATGRAMLANDPHRALSVPSLRYLAHLSAPGLEVIGAGEPALPGLSIGHNGRAAFGLTIFFIDQEDLYVYETKPGDLDAYRYRGRWEPMEIVTTRIPVRGSDPVDARLEFTRHGPVVYRDPARNLAIALRAAWLEPGMSPYLASISTMRARDWDSFLAAMNRWGLPPENMVYADVDGNIGWKPGGMAPVRPNWDGLLPVPGDGRYEWAGFRTGDELPVEANPARGWIATANQMNLPPGYPHALGFEWVMPYRYQRIRELLSTPRRLTLADMAALQTDTRSPTADRVLALLEGLDAPEPRLRRALALLRGWDRDLAAASAAAALYEVWARRHLAPGVVARSVGDPVAAAAIVDEDELFDLFEGGSAEAWIALLEEPASWGGPPARAELLRSSLAAALEETERRLGADWERWSWGRLHVAQLRHPLSELLDESERARVDVGPAPRGGSGDTVNSTGYRLDDFVQRWGASFRMVLDVGRWDESLAMNSPGQSGDPRSPHYRDLFAPWARDESFPLLFHRERIEAAAEQRILLRPAAPRGATPPG